MTSLKLWGAAGALLLASTCAAFAQELSKTFIQEAIQGNLAEVSVGQLAQQKGQSEGVRSFGQTLEADHAAALEQAQAAATEVDAKVPTEPSAKQKKTHDTLAKLSGAKFDREFVADMVKDHKEDIAKYTKQAKGNGPVASYAKQALPTLKKHLDTAQSLQKQTVGSR